MLPPVTEDAVFLNIPYDKNFERPYLAYIIGLVELGPSRESLLAFRGVTDGLNSSRVAATRFTIFRAWKWHEEPRASRDSTCLLSLA